MAAAKPNVSRENWKYLGGALGLHALLALLLVGFSWNSTQTVVPQLAIKAVMVDTKTLNQLTKAARVQPEVVPQAEPQPDPAEEQRKQEEAQRQREQLQEREREQKRQQELEQQRALDKQKQLDQQRKAEAEKQKQAAEKDKQRLAEIQQKQREAEAKRLAAAEAKAQQAREAELDAQLAAEAGRDNAVNAGLLNQYKALIQQKVMRNWIKPPTAKAGLECEVSVTQATGGTVLSVSVGRCNGDAAVRASIEAAVQRASPLPEPPDARLFERNLLFKFKPVE